MDAACSVRQGGVSHTFVAKHQSHSEKAILASWSAFDVGVSHLEPVNKQQSQDDNILGNLGCRKNPMDPSLEILRGQSVLRQPADRLGSLQSLEFLRELVDVASLEPEEARQLLVASANR